jgi:hypothetical protein
MNVSFDFMNTKTKYKDDPCFIHMTETIRVLTHVVVQHFSKFVRLSKNIKTVVALFPIPDAGDVFNKLVSMIPFASVSNSEFDLTSDEFISMMNTFCKCVSENNHLAHLCKSLTNPEDCVFECCHYFFIPSRVDHNSIPKNERLNFIKKWFVTMFALPFINMYTDKFKESINNIPFLQQIYQKLVEDPSKMDKFATIDQKFIYQTISRAYNENNPTQIFLRTYMNVSLIANMEILQKWCPNIKECMNINPTFDGRWINPFDNTFNDQITQIKTIVSNNLITQVSK